MLKILKEIKNLILNNCKDVDKIYLFGSYANGEYTKTSDIDIAVDGDCDFLSLKEKLENIQTLKKIDLIDLKNANSEIVNRIKTQGKVIFSKKELRFEDSLNNFKKALEKFEKILSEKGFFIAHSLEDEYREIAIKRFEYTYESAWRALKRYLEFEGIISKTPREVFKNAYSIEIIENEDIWLSMINDRNYTSHVYDDFITRDIELRLESYLKEFINLYEKLRAGYETL